MYILNWRNPSIDPGKANPINVPVKAVLNGAASVTFTGKGAADYGYIQQINLMRLLENWADGVQPPNPTVGQTWYDSTNKVLKICVSTVPVTWKQLGIQIDINPPTTPSLGELWFKRTGNVTGILYVFTGKGRYPQTGNTVGGWEQIWPVPAIVGGRPEYDEMYKLVMEYIGPVANGGSGALNTTVTGLTNFTALDASMRALYTASGGNDPNAVYPGTDTASLRVEPNSNDWDALLAAAKYAIYRLNLPASTLNNISGVPFVTDGMQAPQFLINYGPSDYRYPTADRLAQTKFGSITMHRLYTETVNTLLAAMKYRYTLRGAYGGTGPQTKFWTAAEGGTVVVQDFATMAGTMSAASTAEFRLVIKFASAAQKASWFTSGGLLETAISFSGAGDLQALVTSAGMTRIVNNQNMVLSMSAPNLLAHNNNPNGFKDVTSTDTQIRFVEGNNCNYSVTLRNASATTLEYAVSVNTTTGVSGNISIVTRVVYDNGGSNAFGRPQAFNKATDVVSKSTFLVAQ